MISNNKTEVLKGLNITSDAIRSTIGAGGRNAFAKGAITNDGVTIAVATEFKDELMNIGALIVKSATAQTNNEVGDGTSTTAVLLQAIIREALKRPENPMVIKRSLARELELLSEHIVGNTEFDINALAMVSAENEEVAKAAVKVKDNHVIIGDSNTNKIEIEYQSGIKIRDGFVNPVFSQNGSSSSFENVKVLTLLKKPQRYYDLKPLFDECHSKGIGNIVIFANDLDERILGELAGLKKAFDILVVRTKRIEDVSIAVDSKIVDSGTDWAKVNTTYLGTAKMLTCQSDRTVIVGTPDMERVKVLEDNPPMNEITAEYRKEIIEGLKGNVALVKVGADTEVERQYLKFKMEDAVHAVKNSTEGVVPGAGAFLWNLSDKCSDSVGGTILSKALRDPLKAIYDNAGYDWERELVGTSHARPLNVVTGFFDESIIDGVKVVRTALKNAIETAGNFITTETFIYDTKD